MAIPLTKIATRALTTIATTNSTSSTPVGRVGVKGRCISRRYRRLAKHVRKREAK
ncbi:alpha-galactosidase [Sesbania bispinosa]|nr:alpha-galactosidase [Sesbania bispinosa]